jgi:SsrA-binding protein
MMPALIQNKKAGFNYELLEKLEAGIELLGFEVKSLRKHQGSLDGSYVLLRGGEAFLVGATIPPFQPGNTPEGYDQRRERRLLLTKKEIVRLSKAADTQGLTIVPISVYNSKRKIKVEIALARGKKKYDKRETLKKRESDRDIQRTLKNE